MSPRAWVLRWHYQLCSCTRLEPRWSAAGRSAVRRFRAAPCGADGRGSNCASEHEARRAAARLAAEWRLRDGGGTAAEPADVRGEGGAVGAGRGDREIAGQFAEGPLDLRDRGDTLRFAGEGREGRRVGAQRAAQTHVGPQDLVRPGAGEDVERAVGVGAGGP